MSEREPPDAPRLRCPVDIQQKDALRLKVDVEQVLRGYAKRRAEAPAMDSPTFGGQRARLSEPLAKNVVRDAIEQGQLNDVAALATECRGWTSAGPWPIFEVADARNVREYRGTRNFWWVPGAPGTVRKFPSASKMPAKWPLPRSENWPKSSSGLASKI